MLSQNSGVGITVKHTGSDGVYNIILGLMNADRTVTKDGILFGYKSHALDHIITFFKSYFGDTVNISSIFPSEVYDEQGNVMGGLQLPYVAVRTMRGPSREVGVGGFLWETNEGTVYAFNQVLYVEFDIFSKVVMKIEQIADHISLQLQKQKRVGGELWNKGFQNFEIIQSDTGRGFRYDTAWDFKMQHQYVDLFHTRLMIRTMFDVVWIDKTTSQGIISQIIFKQTTDYPWETIIGSTLAHLILEDKFFGWW